MNAQNAPSFTPGGVIQRPLLVTLLRTALALQEVRFARQAALKWLAVYPGDLEVQLLLVQAIHQTRGPVQALPQVEKLCLIDPLWVEAQQSFYQYRLEASLPTAAESAACVVALGGRVSGRESIPEWGTLLFKARQALQTLKMDQAEILVQRALLANPPTPLAAVIHLQVTKNLGSSSPLAVRSLAEHYLAHWPDCAPLTLYLGDALMEGGEPERAVDLLHRAVAMDITGQVVRQVWGADHPYRSLWPEDLGAEFDLPIPAKVAAAMGWNQLPQGETRSGKQSHRKTPADETAEAHSPAREKTDGASGEMPKTSSPLSDKSQSTPATQMLATDESKESLRSIQTELEKVARRLKKPEILQEDGRYPVYVVFSTRRGLENQYGKQAAAEIDARLCQLVQVIQADPSWDARLLYGDDPASTTSLGVKPAPAGDPWALKLVLKDVDAALGRKGEMIGALLIVGGPEVVPFHHLPNPVDDEDPDVPSDNPYSTRDENYFIPEWPVGRVPGGAGPDPQPLLKYIEGMIERYKQENVRQPWYQRLIEWLLSQILIRHGQVRPSFGYTAAAWRKASLSVFRPIGEARALLASPPAVAAHLPASGMTPARLGYFNLHGLIDAAEWYGQRDPGEPFEGPDYPVALRPQDVVNSGHSPVLVFTEACFGAHILGKRVEEALALKFLSAGTQAVVGSTCTAYGSIATPLIAADLLGHTFWRFLREGLVAGEALRQAKIALAEEMHRRQGYLDGEDQKTLISFVLYGDPLARPETSPRMHKSVTRARQAPAEVKTVCDRAPDSWRADVAPKEVVEHVRQVVEQYLPGMSDARLTYSREHLACDGSSHQCPTSQLKSRVSPEAAETRQVVTLSKQVQRGDHLHAHYARLTLDYQGKVVKLAVSR